MQTHFVVLMSVLLTLVVCSPFRNPIRDPIKDLIVDYVENPFKDPFKGLFRDPLRGPFTDPYSPVDQLTQTQERSESRAVNTSLYRLPQNLKPTKYDLTVVPFMIEGNFTFYGKVIINITAVQDSSEIVLNSRNLTIRSLSLTDNAKATINTEYSLDDVYERLTIKLLKGSLVADKSYNLTIEYTGLLLDDLFGFYRSSYRIGSQVKWLGITQFEATSARKAFPCFDEPAFRAVFTIHVGRFEYQNTISNMRLKSTSEKLPEFDNRVIDTYEDSPHMPTYLVAFCVSEMTSVTSGDSKLRISMRENAVDQAKYLIGIGETILKTIGDFVNVPYNLPKMDVIAVPDFNAGAMENWGITTYSLLVTPLWWNYTWLNEGFATYFEYKAPDLMEPEWGMMTLFATDQLQLALLMDAVVRTPVTSDVNTPDEITATFNYSTYGKAGSLLRMAEHFLSTPVFQTGLNYYLTNSSKNGIGTPDQLFSALDAAAKEKNVLPSAITVASVLNGWTTQGGYPLLTVSRTGNTITLSQNIFSMDPKDATKTFWYIPLTYTTQSEGNFQDTFPKDWLLPGVNKSISTSDSGWVIFSIQQTGFYRVNYDANNWKLLTEQLLNNLTKIHVSNRAQLLDDALNLAEAGQLELKVALSITRYLSQEKEFAPWVSAARRLRPIWNKYKGSKAGNNFEEYLVSLVRPYYQYLSGINSSSATHQTSLGRVTFIDWACELGISECETYTGNAFNSWFKNGVPIDKDIRSTVLCTGLKQGGDTEWEAVWNLFLQATNPLDRIALLKVLGCTRSETAIDRFLSALVTSQGPFRKNDRFYIFDSITSRQTGLSPMIRFLVNNYDTITKHMGVNTVQVYIAFVSSNLIQDEDLEQVRAVVNNETVPITLRTSFNASLTLAETRIKWAVDHQDDIQPWLSEIGFSDAVHLIPTHTNTLLCLAVVFIVYFKCSLFTTFNCK